MGPVDATSAYTEGDETIAIARCASSILPHNDAVFEHGCQNGPTTPPAQLADAHNSNLGDHAEPDYPRSFGIVDFSKFESPLAPAPGAQTDIDMAAILEYLLGNGANPAGQGAADLPAGGSRPSNETMMSLGTNEDSEYDGFTGLMESINDFGVVVGPPRIEDDWLVSLGSSLATTPSYTQSRTPTNHGVSTDRELYHIMSGL